jgi:predicted RNA-binding Zn ribbon-like protein
MVRHWVSAAQTIGERGMATEAASATGATGVTAETVGLLAGRLCLDFANTADWHAREQPVELLREYRDLVVWSRRVEIVDSATTEALLRRAGHQPGSANDVLARAIELREALYRVFARHARGAPAPDADLATLNRALADAFEHLIVAEHDGAFEWEWRAGSDALDQMLWPIARSAADLLTGPALARVRECEGYPCGWLFLDTSRNRSRRWCSMEVCGNRAKARRHYARTRDGGRDDWLRA